MSPNIVGQDSTFLPKTIILVHGCLIVKDMYGIHKDKNKLTERKT